VVTPHEVAHQWWGQLVGFNSYRDQWMSEGLRTVLGQYLPEENRAEWRYGPYRAFWKEMQKHLLRRTPRACGRSTPAL